MSRLIFILAAVAFGHLVNFQVKSQTLSPEDLDEQCAFLNTVRANFTACCQYPIIVMWRWQLDQCENNCVATNTGDTSNCCQVLCSYRSINLINDESNTANNFTFDPTNGLVGAFMMSLGNDSRWTNDVTEAITFCFNTVIKQESYDTCGIPVHLYDIINCAYSEVFFRCPAWNPNNLPECDSTRQYIDLCSRVKNDDNQ